MKSQSKLINLIVISLVLLLALAACSPSGSGGDVEPGVDSSAELEGSSWTLEEFGPDDGPTADLPNAPITLNFVDGGINGSASCNSYFGEFTQSDSSLTFGAIGSTKMACADDIMQQENSYLTALSTVSSFTLTAEQLTLNYENGRLIFTANTTEEASGEADAEQDETIKTLFVGPELVDCVGVAPQQCLQVRQSEADEWTLFYGQIVGFEYEPGYEYELRVSETEIENPPADASSLEVTLIEVVGKTAVTSTPDAQPEVDSDLQDTSWVLISFGPNDNQTAVLPGTEITLNFDGAQVNGSSGCNSYSAEATMGEDGTLSIGLVASTLMACLDEGVMQQESDFLAALAQVTSYTLSGTELTLHTNDGSLLFTAAADDETE